MLKKFCRWYLGSESQILLNQQTKISHLKRTVRMLTETIKNQSSLIDSQAKTIQIKYEEVESLEAQIPDFWSG